jgi:hypothetical protein
VRLPLTLLVVEVVDWSDKYGRVIDACRKLRARSFVSSSQSMRAARHLTDAELRKKFNELFDVAKCTAGGKHLHTGADQFAQGPNKGHAAT